MKKFSKKHTALYKRFQEMMEIIERKSGWAENDIEDFRQNALTGVWSNTYFSRQHNDLSVEKIDAFLKAKFGFFGQKFSEDRL